MQEKLKLLTNGFLVFFFHFSMPKFSEKINFMSSFSIFFPKFRFCFSKTKISFCRTESRLSGKKTHKTTLYRHRPWCIMIIWKIYTYKTLKLLKFHFRSWFCKENMTISWSIMFFSVRQQFGWKINLYRVAVIDWLCGILLKYRWYKQI